MPDTLLKVPFGHGGLIHVWLKSSIPPTHVVHLVEGSKLVGQLQLTVVPTHVQPKPLHPHAAMGFGLLLLLGQDEGEQKCARVHPLEIWFCGQ